MPRRTTAQPRSRRTTRCDTSSSGAREPAGDGVFGALAANNEIVAYIDDDVVVARAGSMDCLSRSHNPEVAAVTGLVMPFELETEAQEQFELYNGFTFRASRGRSSRPRGSLRRRRKSPGERLHGRSEGAPHRNSTCSQWRWGRGTVTRSGEDTYALYRLLSHGYRIVYNAESGCLALPPAVPSRTFGTGCTGIASVRFVFYLPCLLLHGELSLPSTTAWDGSWITTCVNCGGGLRGCPDAQPWTSPWPRSGELWRHRGSTS